MEECMKNNMHTVNYNGTPNKNGHWWVWNETCDRCGRLILDESMHHSCPGDESELDFCTECLRYLMDNNIPYEQAIVLYGREGKP